MPRDLIIEWADDFAIITPCSRAMLPSFESLLNYLHEKWRVNYQVDETVIQVAERVAALLPRIDSPGCFGFEVRSLSASEFESLFLAQVVNGKILPCKLIELHSFKTEGRKQKAEGEELTPADIPIKSSGLPDADLFASLVNIDESIDGAWRLWTRFDAEMINAMIGQLNELRRDPQERMNEYLKARFDDWKRQNRSSYYQSIGVD
ncbi:MAG: hypothetical protein AB1589_42415 [Cyanobacteriota bacterium]